MPHHTTPHHATPPASSSVIPHRHQNPESMLNYQSELTTLTPHSLELIQSLPPHCPQIQPFGPNQPANLPFSSLHPVLNPLPSKVLPFPPRPLHRNPEILVLFDCPFVCSLRNPALPRRIPCTNSVSGDFFLYKVQALAPNSGRNPGRSAISS
jgi:hypothetical protein